MRFVLRQNADPQVPRVDEVRQNEVDQPVARRRTGPPAWRGPRSMGKGAYPPASQDDAQHVWRFPHAAKPIGLAAVRLANRPIELLRVKVSQGCWCTATIGATGTRGAREASAGYRAHHAGGDDDSGVSARGVRRSGRARDRARRAAAAAVRGRRALHGRAARRPRSSRSPTPRWPAPIRRCPRCRPIW